MAIVAALVLVSIVAAGAVALLGAPRDPIASGDPGRTAGPGASPASLPDAVPVMIRDFVFETAEVTSPTAQKAQSKLWYAEGTWWAGLFTPTTEGTNIFRLDWATQTWVDTGTVVDERLGADPDYLWEDGFLYVASSERGKARSHAARILRFRYDAEASAFRLDPDFPVPITETGTNAIVITRDSRDTLWVTYVDQGRVMIAHTLGSDAIWTPGYQVPGSGQVLGEDISSAVAFGPGRVGVMWSDQATNRMLFVHHEDGADDASWSTVEVVAEGVGSADNHLNLKTFERDGARLVAAAVKTSLDAVADPNPLASQILVMIREADGRWTGVEAGRVQDHHSRPILLIDEVRRLLYVAAQSPFNGGVIHLKRASLDNPTFDTGLGEVLLASDLDARIANATSTKQSISPDTGLVVMASDDGTGRFLHAAVDLGRTPLSQQVAELPRPDVPPAPASGPARLVHDEFDSWPDGATDINGWRSTVDGGGTVAVALDDDAHLLRLRSTGAAGSAETCKDIPRALGAMVRVDVRLRVTAAGAADVRLATVRIPGAEIVGLRVDGDGLFSYFDGDRRERTAVSLVDGRWYRAVLDIDVAARQADIRIAGPGGDAVFARSGAGWRTDKAAEPSRVCFRVSSGAATLDIDSILVSR